MKLQNEMLWEKPGQSLLVSLTLLCSPGNNAEQQIKCLTTHNLMLHLQSAVKRKKKKEKKTLSMSRWKLSYPTGEFKDVGITDR